MAITLCKKACFGLLTGSNDVYKRIKHVYISFITSVYKKIWSDFHSTAWIIINLLEHEIHHENICGKMAILLSLWWSSSGHIQGKVVSRICTYHTHFFFYLRWAGITELIFFHNLFPLIKFHTSFLTVLTKRLNQL